MAKPKVFGSLQMALAALGAAWAGLIFSDRQDWTHLLGIDNNQLETPAVNLWIIGNAFFAFMAFIAALMVLSRHPDAKAFAIFSWAILMVTNAPFVWMSFTAGSAWPVIWTIVFILVTAQTAMFGYRRVPRAAGRGGYSAR